jgi:hypothetical protein
MAGIYRPLGPITVPVPQQEPRTKCRLPLFYCCKNDSLPSKDHCTVVCLVVAQQRPLHSLMNIERCLEPGIPICVTLHCCYIVHFLPQCCHFIPWWRRINWICIATALARPRNNSAVNYRPVLSSERALQNNKHAAVRRKFRRERKIGHGSQMGAWHQDRLADWLSVVN